MPFTGNRTVELRQDARRLMVDSIANSTKSVYDSALSTYRRFCLLSGYSITQAALPPVSEVILMNFATHCHTNFGLAHSTIKLYICGLRFHYLLSGITSPFSSDMLRLQLLLRGIKRNDTHPQRPRHPITGDILKTLCSRLQQGLFGQYTDMLMTTVCITAFFGFLRCGEFTCGASFDPQVNLCVSDIIQDKNCILLHLKQSKTDPFRQGVHIKLFCNGTLICPKCQIMLYLQVRNSQVPVSSNRDPLFVTIQGAALSRKTFLALLTQTFKAANLNSAHFTGHSFRIGAATSASATSCIGDHMIKTLGRWNSDSYCRYIRTPLSAVQAAQVALAATCV